MSIFYYKAIDERQRFLQGRIEAASQDLAANVLLDKNLTILVLKEEKFRLFGWLQNFISRVPQREIVIFSRQLAVMVSANVPLVQALNTMSMQTTNNTLKIMIQSIADDVEGGAKLSVALSKYSRVFSNFFISLVKSGETSGKLDEILNYLADEQEKDYELMSRIKGMMTYPIFVFSGLIIVGVIMMVWVVPKLIAIIEESGAELPITTRMLIASSDFMVKFWWLLIILVVVSIVSFRLSLRNESVKFKWDLFKLRLPIFGELIQKVTITRFTRSMHTLITASVPITRSLEIVSEVVGNSVYTKMIKDTIKEVEEGNSISIIFEQSKDVPPLVSQTMRVGERAGKLDEVLEKLASFYGRQVTITVENLMTLIEPVILVIMGLAVGVLVSAIILPIYGMASGI